MFSKHLFLRALVAMAIATCATAAAKANTLDFTLTGNGTDITFSLNASPTVLSSSNSDGDFVFDNVLLDVNGHENITDVAFFTNAFGGGLEAGSGNNDLFNLFGAQLFTGSLNAPTFQTGTFALESKNNGGGPCNESGFTLTIADPSAVTPEPSSVLLLATGMITLIGAGSVKRYVS